MPQSAQTKARTLLGQQFKEELKELYEQEKLTARMPTDTKSSDINARARGRALSKLVKRHYVAYQALYQICRLKGYPGNGNIKVIHDQ